MRLSLVFTVLVGCGSASHGNRGDDDTDAGVPLVPPQGCDAQDDDGDGWSNAVEAAMGTSPADASDNPDTRNEIVFAVPLHGAPRPANHVIESSAKIARADVAILLDTTGSMLGTDTRIQTQFQALVAMLAGEVDDLAFGAAGLGDFPINDGANSQYDVPFYLVHRMMTARTAAGKSSILGALAYHNIISDGLGPWFAGMRGGDEPEQGWEALRQMSLGTGITYPLAGVGTGSVPAFSSSTAYPTTLPAGEERGTIGGMGFRADSLPIVIIVTDTTQHTESLVTTNPHSADYPTALAAVNQIGAKVIGVNTYFGAGQADLKKIANATGAHVAPETWGTGAARPANCPVGKCCVIANDPQTSGNATQPSPVVGQCPLVFTSDRYDDNLAAVLEQAVVGVARGARFDASAVMTDDASDDVDAVASFVDHLEAVTDGSCANGHAVDRDGDGVAETFDAVVPSSTVCFRITTKANTTIEPSTTGRKFRAVLQLTGDGLADLTSREVWFVVPASDCTGIIE